MEGDTDQVPNQPIIDENKKRTYFTNLSLEVLKALRLHKEAGLLGKKEGEQDDWRNVSEHCLVEVARVSILAEKLNLPQDIIHDLKLAAALHDFFKKGEIEIVTSEGSSWTSFEKASQKSTRKMQEANFSDRIVRLANSVGHNSLEETTNILNQEKLSHEDIAYLILHYVDDYTIDSNWASAIATNNKGERINDLDRRMNRNENNRKYDELNKEGQKKFSGETTYQAQRRIGHMVEKKLADLLAEKTREKVIAKELPQIIDEEIKSRIASS